MGKSGSFCAIIAASCILLTSCSPPPEGPASESVATSTDGWEIPTPSENSDHDYILEDNRIPRIENCELWAEFWVYEGPAVSFAVAAVYDEPKMAVSTQIYVKNQHLDSDKDGVICYLEGKPKPLVAAKKEADEEPETSELQREDWVLAALSVREAINSDSSAGYPLDFAASPSVLKRHETIVRDGVELALRFWAPFIDSSRPLAMTVVHPNDKTWFLDRWEELGRDNTGEFWWNLAKDGGGGAVGWTASGIPNMYFMTSESFAPPSGPVDYYVHEVTHFFQTVSLGAGGEAAAPCWYPEGTANFIGFSMTYPNDEKRTIDQFAFTRKERAKILMDFYDSNGGLTNQRLERDILNFPQGDPTCQHEAPQFGYNLGMFVSEKLIIDFGFEAFIDMTKKMGDQALPEAFESTNGTEYRKWVRDQVFPYIIETLKKESR